MKKLMIYMALLTLTLSACKKSNLPDQRPDDRINAQLAAYQTQLTGATDGWIGYMFPTGGGAYTFTFQFNNSNRVVTQADINATSISTPLESSYRLKAAMLPSLYFDTYTYLHLLADPDPTKSGGATGQGLTSDFEFSFISSSTDTIKLKGNVNNSDLILIRKKASDGADFISKAAAFNTTLYQMENFIYFYNQITLNGKNYDIDIDPEVKTVNFFYSDNGAFKSFSTEYALSSTGLVLRKPFIAGTTVITEMHNLGIDVTQSKLSFTSGSTNYVTTNIATPVAVSLDAAKTMYTAPNASYGSVTGFIVGGVIDFYRVSTIPGFSYIAFIPNYYTNPLDAMFMVYGATNKIYGPVFNTSFGTNGAMLWTNPGGYALQGTSPGATYATLVTNFRTQMLTPLGYYVFPTSSNSYDVVSVADGKTWMRF